MGFILRALLFVSATFAMPSTYALQANLSMDEMKIVEFTNSTRDEQLILLEKLVNISSGTSNLNGVVEAGEAVQHEFKKLGFKTRWEELPSEMKHAGTLVATHEGKGPALLLIAHLDTVNQINKDAKPFYISPDRKKAYGPGVIDDKGGIVTIIYALKALQNQGKLHDAHITVMLIGDEEQAAKPTIISRAALIEAAKKSEFALGFEFSLSENQLVTNRRGLSEWVLTGKGVSGHSSQIFHDKSGYGAIFETSRVLNEFRADLSAINGLTFNPGIILGGQQATEDPGAGKGEASGQKTIIASTSLIRGDLRFLSDDQKTQAEQYMISVTSTPLPRTSSEIVFNDIIPVMTETEQNKMLLTHFSSINEALGGSTITSVPANDRGGADISYIAKYVTASIDGLGPWGEGAHSRNENMEIDSLPVVINRAAIFINRYLSGKI